MGARELSVNTLIHNRYRVDKVLGAGGFGITYRVTDLKENKIAAMKEYMPLDIAYRPMGSRQVRPTTPEKQKHYEKFRNQFLEEAQTINKFQDHPNIIKVSHLFCENNTAYYVMEFMDGMDLGKFLQQQGGRVSWDTLRPILAQAVSALKRVHDGGMVHCDVSTGNIFLLKTGTVKLLDFGAAKSTMRCSMETSVILANPGFAPYEQMTGKKLGPWTDVYALAVTVYRCITGKLPPSSEDRILNDSTIWPSQMGVAIPSEQWEQALKKAMALRADDRYQSVMEFWNALNAGNPVSQPIPPETHTEKTHVGGWQPPRPPVIPAPAAPVLVGIQGAYCGMRIRIQEETLLGVDGMRCRITYPPGTPGISRVHLRLWPAGSGGMMVMDMGSTYGSWLGGKKMSPGLAYRFPAGAALYLGNGQVFRAETDISGGMSGKKV